MEKSCCLREGFLAYPIMRDPNTEPMPAPDPATPTVAAPAPMNLAALSMSCLGAEVWSREVAWALAGLTLLIAAMARRGDTDRRAMADILLGGYGWSSGLKCGNQMYTESLVEVNQAILAWS